MCSRWTSINRLNEKGRIAVLPFSLFWILASIDLSS